MKTLLCFVFLSAGLFAQTRITPDCAIPFNFSAAGAVTSNSTCGAPNGSPNTQGIASWIVVYSSTGFSAVSLEVQSAPDNSGSPGTWVSFAGTVLSNTQYPGSSGINPNTATTSAFTGLAGYYRWMRVKLISVSGSGTVTGNLYGYLNSTLAKASGGGGPPTGACGGDLGGTFPNCTVVNLSNVTNASLKNSGLVNPSTTVNGQTCTLGGSCTVSSGPTTNQNIRSFGASFNGGGAPLGSGPGAIVYVTVPFACTIGGYNITADLGTISFDVWRLPTGTAVPTITNTILSGGYLALSTGTALHSTSTALFTSVAVAANDILGFNIQAASGTTNASLVIPCTAS